ncbi:hypothetical protein, partial [Aminobacterium sp. UBA4834]
RKIDSAGNTITWYYALQEGGSFVLYQSNTKEGRKEKTDIHGANLSELLETLINKTSCEYRIIVDEKP